MNSTKPKVRFKTYNPKQNLLLPPSLEELIPQDHLVRLVDQVVDRLDIKALLCTYKGGGTSSYHPRMLLKVLLYSYLNQIYSCRDIAKAVRENIHYMWLSGMSRPSFKTINNFRLRLGDSIDEIFTSLLLYCAEKEYVDLEEYFVDGTKLRADGNKHKVVWRKNTERYKQQVLAKVRELLTQIDHINEEEDRKYGDKDLKEMGEDIELDSHLVQQEIDHLAEQISNQTDKQLKREQGKVKTQLVKKQKQLAKYEQQEQTLDGRNSYSKTDPDATFMRSKDDQLLPAYNVTIGTQNQFILHYSLSQNASDSASFIAHMQRLPESLKPSCVMGDSAYGSEQNYTWLDKNQIDNYLKFNSFHSEQTKKHRENIFHKDNFIYNADTDSFTCPDGRMLPFIYETTQTLRDGFKTTIRVYESVSCHRCPLKEKCVKGKGNRVIKVRPQLEKYKQQARDNLNSEKGIQLRKQRGVDVETPFADIKHNAKYRRLRLRGLKKVNIEVGLLSIVHNIKKINTEIKEKAA